MPQDDHGPRPVTIIVNTRPHPWDSKDISFEQAVELAYPGDRPTPRTSRSGTAAVLTGTGPGA